MIKEKIYREKDENCYIEEVVAVELSRLEKEILIKISENLEVFPIESILTEDKLMPLLSGSNFKVALLNTLASLVVICNIGSFLGIPILGDELFNIGKKVSKADKTMKDFSSTSEYVVYLKNEVNVENFIVEKDIETYIYEGIGGIVLLNLISEKMKIRVAPNFVNILKNIELRPTEILDIIREFSKRHLDADLDLFFAGNLPHNERIKIMETLKGALMTTILTMSEIGAYDKIDEMREENKEFKKMLSINLKRLD